MPINALNYTIINPIISYSLFRSLLELNSIIYLTLLWIFLSLQLLII